MKQIDIDKLIQAMKSVFATKDEIDQRFTDLDIKITKLDAKQDNMDIKLDGFLGEILASREEQTFQSETIDNHTDELEKHEQRIKVLEQRKQSSPVLLSSLT